MNEKDEGCELCGVKQRSVIRIEIAADSSIHQQENFLAPFKEIAERRKKVSDDGE